MKKNMERLIHYDLFAGIGGFSIAFDQVFQEYERKHIFCEWEHFPTEVLKKHWSDGTFYGDIRDLIADSERAGRKREQGSPEGQYRLRGGDSKNEDTFILTGGFPCQPFSHAGRRRGTEDDRYLWPAMFRAIQILKPTWVIAENVRGLVTWNDGMVLEQVCTDLESEGYEVQPFIIPACSVGAPHRRDRVWIVANSNDARSRTPEYDSDENRTQSDNGWEGQPLSRTGGQDSHAPNTGSQRRNEGSGESIRPESEEPKRENRQYFGWNRNWQEIALATCHDGMDDGLPREVGGVSYSFAKWRKEALKAYGNAIVPQVAVQILESIKKTL